MLKSNESAVQEVHELRAVGISDAKMGDQEHMCMPSGLEYKCSRFKVNLKN